MIMIMIVTEYRKSNDFDFQLHIVDMVQFVKNVGMAFQKNCKAFLKIYILKRMI